jgi:hypothetical protein
LWHLTVFKTRYDELAIYRDDVVIPMGLASMAIQAVAFAWLYPRITPDTAAWRAGAWRFFLIAGGLAFSYAVLPVAAKYRMTAVSEFVALESAFTILHFAVVAPLVALASRPRGSS